MSEKGGHEPYREIERAVRLAVDCGLDRQAIRDMVQYTLLDIDAEELRTTMWRCRGSQEEFDREGSSGCQPDERDPRGREGGADRPDRAASG